jgi:hypothetical protein
MNTFGHFAKRKRAYFDPAASYGSLPRSVNASKHRRELETLAMVITGNSSERFAHG